MRTKLLPMKRLEVFVKRISLGVLFITGTLFIEGCSRCEECQLQGDSETICETEFDTPDQYEDAIADREAQGAVCTSTGGF